MGIKPSYETLERRIRVLESIVEAGKETKKSLQQQEDLFRSIVQSSPIAMYFYELKSDNRLVLTGANPSADRILGIPHQSLIGKTIEEAFPNLVQTDIPEMYRQVARRKIGHQNFEVPYKDDRFEGYYNVHVFSTLENQIAVNFVDISDRRKMEEELREKEERFSLAAEQSHTFTWEVDAKGMYTYTHPVIEQVTGFSPAAVVGNMHFYDFTPTDIREEFKAAAFKVFEARGTFRNMEGPAVRRDGSIVWGLISGSPIIDEAGNLVGYRGSTTDITERKDMDAERDRLREQLWQSQKMESIGRLAGGVAHDFNNMLNVILGHAELLLYDMDHDSPMKKDLEAIRKSAERSANLTQQLLAFARKQTNVPKTIDLNQTVESMLKMLRRLIGEDIELIWNPAEGLAPISIDPSQLDQILANLAINARDAIGLQHGKITIETAAVYLDGPCDQVDMACPAGDYLVLTVGDNGCGIEEENLDKIFDPFFTTKPIGGGTGLGLSTVYGIVKQNMGCVKVYSKTGIGTTMRVYLPASEGPVEMATEFDGPERGMESGSGTILLVEDEKAILEITQTILQKNGYRILATDNTDEAIRIARACDRKIDLLISDVVMPGMNGYDLAQLMNEIHPGLKTLFISGYTQDIIKPGVPEKGNINFLQKPFSIKQISAIVKQIMADPSDIKN